MFIKYFIILISLPLIAFGYTHHTIIAEKHGGQVPGRGQIPAIRIENPLKAKTFTELVDDLADFFIVVLSPIAVIMVLWSAFLFMTSGGNVEKIDMAKKTLRYALIGAAILIIAKGIPTTIESFFEV